MRRNGSKEAKCARRGHYNETPGSELTIGTTPATDSTTTHSHSQHHKHHLSHLLDVQSDVLILNITSFGCEYFAAITQEVSLHKLINVMSRRTYEVIEYRGCDVEYSVFQGYHEECSQWLEDNCFQDVDIMGDTNWVSNDSSNVNGNGFAFRYTIREVTNGVEA